MCRDVSKARYCLDPNYSKLLLLQDKHRFNAAVVFLFHRFGTDAGSFMGVAFGFIVFLVLPFKVSARRSWGAT